MFLVFLAQGKEQAKVHTQNPPLTMDSTPRPSPCMPQNEMGLHGKRKGDGGGRVFEMVTIQTFTDDLFQPYHLAVVVRDLSISRQQEKKIGLRIRNLSSSAGSAHFVTVGWSLNL